jgi:putative ABC transport system permease protein
MHDFRDAFRALRATPIISLIAALSLALGIGANTAIFSILNSLILRSLPVRDPLRLASVQLSETGNSAWTNPLWEQVRERPDLFDGAFAYGTGRFNLAQGGQTEFVDGVWTSGRYFEVLGVSPILGRTFTATDDRRGGGPDGPVAVIGYKFWQQRFGGAADVIGRPLTVERVPFTIIGVAPPDFLGTDVGRTFDVAIPLGTEPLIRGKESSLDRRSHWWLSVIARLKPGQSIESATAALRGVQPQIREATMPQDWREQDKQSYLKEAFTVMSATTGNSGLRGRYRRPLTTMLVVVGLVLLIACANIANLLLARATARRHELSVRVALGASRIRLARQLLWESLILSGVGAAGGLAFAHWGSRLLVRQLSTSTNNVFLDLSVDWRVLGFTGVAAIAAAVLFGTVPALRATRVQPNEALKEQGRSVIGDGPLNLGSSLVIVQVALSLMLVVAAGLFMRTFSSLAKLDLGFNRAPVLVATVNAQRLQLEPPQRPELFARMREAAAAVPGVASATVSAVTPVSGSTWQFGLESIDGKRIAEREGGVYVNLIGPDWFKTFGTSLIAGRDFTKDDKGGSPVVAIVNEAFARKFTGGANPIGKRMREPERPARPSVEREIVGYVKDAVYRSLRDPVPATMYLAVAQHHEPPSAVAVSVRSAGGAPAQLTRSLAAALTAVNPNVAITFRPLDEQVNASLTQERMLAMLSGFFGALALLLAGLGLFGVTSYAVSRRRTEIGIRMALGAAPGGVVRLILGRVAMLIGIGVVAGTGGSLWASRFVATLLYGLEPRDVSTLVGAPAVLAIIGVLAGWIPARRASRIDPARVLREG